MMTPELRMNVLRSHGASHDTLDELLTYTEKVGRRLRLTCRAAAFPWMTNPL